MISKEEFIKNYKKPVPLTEAERAWVNHLLGRKVIILFIVFTVLLVLSNLAINYGWLG